MDKTTRDEIISRINSLNETTPALWGKMNLYQMIRHCIIMEEMYMGKSKYKQSFIGRIFGKMALKGFLKDDKILDKNVPTVPEAKTKKDADGDVIAQKNKWMALIEEYANASDTVIIHAFFGTLNKEQIGYLAYKHADHHLRQFNS